MALAAREWAKEKPVYPSAGKGCWTCNHYPEFVPVIREYLQMRAGCHPSGIKTDRGYKAFHRDVLEPSGYPLKLDAYESHVKCCEAELWRAKGGVAKNGK